MIVPLAGALVVETGCPVAWQVLNNGREGVAFSRGRLGCGLHGCFQGHFQWLLKPKMPRLRALSIENQ